jgi:hypothetical protein
MKMLAVTIGDFKIDKIGSAFMIFDKTGLI